MSPFFRPLLLYGYLHVPFKKSHSNPSTTGRGSRDASPIRALKLPRQPPLGPTRAAPHCLGAATNAELWEGISGCLSGTWGAGWTSKPLALGVPDWSAFSDSAHFSPPRFVSQGGVGIQKEPPVCPPAFPRPSPLGGLSWDCSTLSAMLVLLPFYSPLIPLCGICSVLSSGKENKSGRAAGEK